MNTKTKKKTDEKIVVSTDEKLDIESNASESAISEKPLEASVSTVDIDSHFKTLLVGYAPKLSSKSLGLIGYEVALNTEDKCRYLRLTSNDSGGLFSKEWVKLDDLYALLDAMEADTPFKSSVFKSVMKGGSANNVSFLSAVLRSEEIALILKSEKSLFLHVVNPLLINQRDRLAKLKPMQTSSEK